MNLRAPFAGIGLSMVVLTTGTACGQDQPSAAEISPNERIETITKCLEAFPNIEFHDQISQEAVDCMSDPDQEIAQTAIDPPFKAGQLLTEATTYIERLKKESEKSKETKSEDDDSLLFFAFIIFIVCMSSSGSSRRR